MAQLGPAPKPQRKREQNSSRAALACAAALTSKEIKKKRRKVLSREGTKLKFVTGPRPAHEHGENRARNDNLMAEPENRPPPLQA